MKRLLTLALAGLLLNPFNAFAGDEGDGHSHKDPTATYEPLTDIKVNSGEVLLEVHGIVCSFCSKGVQKKVSKLSFVDTSKYTDGVLVEIDKQRVTVAIKPDAQADVTALYEAVKSGGYEPVAAYKNGGNNKIVKFNSEGSQCTDISSC